MYGLVSICNITTICCQLVGICDASPVIHKGIAGFAILYASIVSWIVNVQSKVIVVSLHAQALIAVTVTNVVMPRSIPVHEALVSYVAVQPDRFKFVHNITSICPGISMLGIACKQNPIKLSDVAVHTNTHSS